jgi:hypothetical protein
MSDVQQVRPGGVAVLRMTAMGQSDRDCEGIRPSER